MIGQVSADWHSWLKIARTGDLEDFQDDGEFSVLVGPSNFDEAAFAADDVTLNDEEEAFFVEEGDKNHDDPPNKLRLVRDLRNNRPRRTPRPTPMPTPRPPSATRAPRGRRRSKSRMRRELAEWMTTEE